MYSPEDGLPNPICKNCKWNGFGCERPEDDLEAHEIHANRNNGGTDCEAHEYREPDGPDDYDDRHEKGE